jgi:hypothetical protein
VLGRAATDSPGFSRESLLALGGILAGAGSVLGLLVSHWLGASDEGLVAAEIVALIGSWVIGIAIAIAIWWLFPPVEIFPVLHTPYFGVFPAASELLLR